LIVTSSRFHGSEDLPHWVSVTGIDDTFLYFSDPSDARKRKRKIRLDGLGEFLGYHGAQSMVEVWKD
jgi:hypothetical protein